MLSYSYLAVLVPIFLLTDYLRYKPVLLLQALSYICLWLLLLWGRSVLHMQLMELFYSITMAARIAYSSYIFSLVRPARYQRMAGYSRTAVLLGVFTSSVLGQLLVTVGRLSFSTLNCISLAFLTFSLLLALFLKRPKRSLFFNRSSPVGSGATPSELDRMSPGPGRPAGRKAGWMLLDTLRRLTLVRMLWELRDNLRLPQLRLWSLWWVFNSAGYYLIVYYVHILWNVVNPTNDTTEVYNGGVDAASTLLGTPYRPRPPFLPCRDGRDMSYLPRCHHLLCCGLRDHPLGPVGGAGHRGRDSSAGWAHLPHVQHAQHLAVLRGLCALPRLLPVPGAHCHVSRAGRGGGRRALAQAAAERPEPRAWLWAGSWRAMHCPPARWGCGVIGVY